MTEKDQVESTKEDQRPSWQHYPDDWWVHFAGSEVSLAAQGLWKLMLCRMWIAPQRGYLLKDNGEPWTVDLLAQRVGKTAEEVEGLLTELDKERVFSRRVSDGAIYCRRWIREKTLSEVRSEVGRMGGRPKSKGKANGKQKKQDITSPGEGVGEEVGVGEGLNKEDRMKLMAGSLVKLYGVSVKPPSMDTSLVQARKNAAMLLRDGLAFPALQQAILNYAEACAILQRKPEYRKNAGNFFGRESVYEQFMEKNYEQPRREGNDSGKPQGQRYRESRKVEA